MAAPTALRQISIAKPTAASRQNGGLPVLGAGTISRNSTQSQKSREAKLKVVIRRLAPGLTEEEFSIALGEEWMVGGGKVDWTSYQKGKVAKDAAKPSRPSRAYLHLTHPQYLGPLADKVRTTQFIDGRGSSSDSVLLGPPLLVFTPFSKIPGKPRADGRQGTIDQDPEFINFLTSLTTPVTKPANIDSAVDKESKSADAKIITPLVQYIKDKKANKAKDGRSQKHIRQELKDNKGDDKKLATKGGKGKAATIDKKVSVTAKADKAKQQPAAKTVKNPPTSSPVQAPVALVAQPVAQLTPAPPKPERRRERGNASMAAKILQRDLALANGASGRRKRENPVPASEASAPKPLATNELQSQASVASTDSATIADTKNTPAQPPSGPVTARKTQPETTKAQQPTPAPARSASIVSPLATQAFLKHANPSQGVTEPLLEQAFKAFGDVIKVEIDKKKGFAYIDFADASGLQKAIAASPIKVAQGQVVVLERKTGTVLQNRNARGQQGSTVPPAPPHRGGRGGGRARSGRGPSNPSKAANVASTSTPIPEPVSTPT